METLERILSWENNVALDYVRKKEERSMFVAMINQVFELLDLLPSASLF